jgi:hypothetical protein
LTCSTCAKWFVRKETHYGNGEIIINRQIPEGCGECQVLNIATNPAFECNQYQYGTPIVEIAHKDGEPWQHARHGPCPDCMGKGLDANDRRDDRCCGTGIVLFYDDGYIGNNRTKRHPKEMEFGIREDAPTPTCFNCHKSIELTWFACPYCGTRLKQEKVEPAEVL